MRILIADDEILWLNELEILLRRFFPDAEIVKVATVPAMEEVIRSGGLNLVAKDCRLSGTAGELRVKWLREHGVLCPIVIVSGSADVVREAIADGANGGCTKEQVYSELGVILRRLGLIT